MRVLFPLAYPEGWRKGSKNLGCANGSIGNWRSGEHEVPPQIIAKLVIRTRQKLDGLDARMTKERAELIDAIALGERVLEDYRRGQLTGRRR